MTSSVTRRRNSASDACLDGATPRLCSLAKTSRSIVSHSGTSGTVTTRPVGTDTRAEASQPLYEATTAVSPGRRPRTAPLSATSATASSRTRRSQKRCDVLYVAVGEPRDDRRAGPSHPGRSRFRALGRISIRSTAPRDGSRLRPPGDPGADDPVLPRADL